MYMSEPLSATIRPYVFMARKIFWTAGGEAGDVLAGLQAQPRAHRQRADALLPGRVCEAGIDVAVGARAPSRGRHG